VADYLSCILFKVTGFCVRRMPLSLSCFLGRRLGGLLYYFDIKHRAVAYANIKTAFGKNLAPRQLRKLTREFYRSFGQNLLDVFLIPLIDEKYINKFITLEGRQYIDEAFKKGNGVIFLGVHAGSWELSNIICANLGFPFSVLVREQKFPRLNQLLNSYRMQKGCKIIERQSQTRQLIEALKNNEAVGLTVDQGGKSGCLVKFFGQNASMATGAIKLALRYDSVILPGYYARIKGPYIKTIIEPPFQVKKTGDLEKDIHDNLQQLIPVFEKNIEKHAKDYLWTYKIWKYTLEKNILILNDGKAGHLRQAQAVAGIAAEIFRERGVETKVDTVEIKFKSNLSRHALTLSSCLSGKYNCQGCLSCLKMFLEEKAYRELVKKRFDAIVSCGSSLAQVNFLLSRENLAKSIVVMKPSILGMRRFDLVIMPQHDNPPKRKNVVSTEGALNLIDERYLKEQSQMLINSRLSSRQPSDLCIGLLIGGDTKDFSLDKDAMLEAIAQIKSAAEKLNADILVTTSRRTSAEVEEAVKEEFKSYPRCKLLIIANEKNVPEAVGGILGLSRILITSPESISMISEASRSKKHVLVLDLPGLNKKHQRFIEHFTLNKYIYLTKARDFGGRIEQICRDNPEVNTLKDDLLLKKEMGKIL